MTFGQIRLIRLALLLVLIVVAAVIGQYVWSGMRDRSTAELDFDEPLDPVSREVQIEQLDSEGNTAWTLKAAESTGRTESGQEFRDVEIRFAAGDAQTPVIVTADRCEIQKDSAVFLEGNVIVRDESTLRLEANTLHFRRQPDRIWSTEPVRYFGKGLQGDAGTMSYLTEVGDLELHEGVAMTLSNRGEAPIDITSLRAVMRRRQNRVRYIDEVRVRQKHQALDANDLQLYFTEDRERIERIEAYERVDLRLNVPPEAEPAETGEAATAKASLTSEPGMKRLLTDKLEVLMREDGEHIERARALEGGKLLIRLPDDATSGYHKELEGYTLAFDFDEAGQLTELRGRGGVTLVLVPVTEAAGERKVVNARQLEARFDPVTGEMEEAVCEQAVTFEQGNARAEAELGTFIGARSLLILEQNPKLWDDRARLEADEIRLGVESGDVEGIGNVRSTSMGEGNGAGGKSLFPGSADGSEPVYFVAQHLSYRRAEDVAVYTDHARGFQGTNRIEADRIDIHQTAANMEARGNVRTVFQQRLTSEERADKRPTVTLAEELDYRSEEHLLLYRGKVDMRAEDMSLTSDRVDVTLAQQGGDVEMLDADGDVAIQTLDGRAAGEHAKYLPKEDSMTVTGERAWLENDGNLTEGKQLTFFLTDDRVLVDGRELSRTKTTYTSKSRPE